MKTFQEFIAESSDSHDIAKKGFNELMALSKTIGSYRGDVGVYYHHKGGQLSRTFVGEKNRKGFGKDVTGKPNTGHFFAHHYSSGPGHNAYTHVRLPSNTDLSDVKSIHNEIEKQNPHNKGTGHSISLANDIAKYHGNK